MKIESISIQHFKLFNQFEVSFKHKTLEEVSDQFLILGDNGTGKTTLLQAIALPLALATKQIVRIADFDWPGFLSERFWKWGIPRIQLEISFVDEEIEATREIAKQWYDAQPEEFKSEHPFVEPSDCHAIQISLTSHHWKIGQNTPAERFQFQGRYYAQQQLLWSAPSVRPLFSKLPGIFWFDQYRNLVSNAENRQDESNGHSFSKQGIARLRDYLIELKRQQGLGIAPNDELMTLEQHYQKIFAGRTFSGLEMMPSLESPMAEQCFFVLNDGEHTYDIVEMSAGEQSIFPILYEFVQQQIAYSVVLIDEVDLNLHPPAAQSLLRQLLKISPTCQFILTTHSEAVSDVISGNETLRLPGGSLCL
ncbi:MAG: AAA family ATPase [Candidatus Parabeggiatoa sp. nov. 3]|nr:MAG: AAA family ATPase [Gammaproteobacteria bacterium]RKZ63791.1 MAG: AAA family ATPase [Gammaproteobacteria bacterium]RKZ82889.1 MAG: AAA family ATPase [Gammaproteobacteria bacterium]